MPEIPSEIEKARLKKRFNEILDQEIKSPRDSLELMMIDIDLGILDAETVVSFVSTREPAGLRVSRYIGNANPDVCESFWLLGMVQRGMDEWLGEGRN